MAKQGPPSRGTLEAVILKQITKGIQHLLTHTQISAPLLTTNQTPPPPLPHPPTHHHHHASAFFCPSLLLTSARQMLV